MSGSRTKSRGSIGLAEWLVDRRLALVVRSKGSYGFSEDSVQFLSPYETLYVIECQEYEVTLSGLPLSLEEAHSICLLDERDSDVYRVYVSLMKQGLRFTKEKPQVFVARDVRSGVREAAKTTKRDIIEEEKDNVCSDAKRRRQNSTGSLPFCHPDPHLSNLTLSHVRHREFVVPPIHDYLKEKAKNWTEYKDINCYLDQNFIGRIIDLPDEVNDQFCQKLPSSILNTDVTRCINQFHSVLSLNDLCKKLQDHGPKTYISPRANDYLTPASLHFKTDEDEDGRVIVVHVSDPLPSPQLIHDLSRDAILIVAVVDESLIKLFRFLSVTDWQELPSLWLQHVE